MSAIDVGELLGKLSQHRGERAAISTVSLNLVAFVEDDAQLLERIAQRIDALAERNVSRTILLTCDERPHSASSHSSEVDDTLITRSEQIQLAVGHCACEELRSAVHELLVPSVRTVLLWAGAHYVDRRLSALADLADTVVLFSSARDPGTARLQEILKLQGTHVEPKIHDLAFMRLLSWQDIIAQFFDDAELAQELPHLTHVEVVSGSATEAYYLVGWLGSRLSWQPCGENQFCNEDGGTISFDLRQHGSPLRVYAVRLHSHNCVFGAAVREDADDLICVTVEGRKSRPQRCMPLHDLDMVSLIERAIFMPRNDEVFAGTLRTIDRLLELAR